MNIGFTKLRLQLADQSRITCLSTCFNAGLSQEMAHTAKTAHKTMQIQKLYARSDHEPAKIPVLNIKRPGTEMEILFITLRGSKINV